MRFYCGTYTTRLGHVDGQARGIQIYDLDGTSGKMSLSGESPDIANTSHLCLGADGEHVYAISEIVDYNDQADGCITVLAIDGETGNLNVIQTVSSAGPGPAYVHLDPAGRFLLLANYVAGNVVVYPIRPDGRLEEPVANIMHRGRGENADRQEGPHPHAIVPSPDSSFVFVPDLGIDRIVAYRFDADLGRLTPMPSLDVVTPAGSGPRHFVFAPDGQSAYCSLELSSEVAAFAYSAGKLTPLSRHSSLPQGANVENTNAEIRVAPDGRHVYVSNRGHDSIAVYAMSDALGTIRFVETVETRGKTPRNFGISPDGNWVVVANQDSHNLTSFRRDVTTGRLIPTESQVDCPSPALIRFAE